MYLQLPESKMMIEGSEKKLIELLYKISKKEEL
jgi:hypothetical protein